jgi:solute:Na+ symporter, SSS family
MFLIGYPLMVGAVGRVDALVIAAYLGLMAVIGAMAWRRRGDARSYFQAGRAMPAWAVALSVVATSLSVTTFIGAPAESYSGDLTYLSQNLGVFVAVIFVAIWFVPRLYAAGTITIYGFIEKRYGATARTALAVTFLVGRLLASGVRLFIAAIPLSLVLFGVAGDRAEELRHWVMAIVIIGAVGTGYTVFGGIRAVIWTDAVQISIVVGAVVLSIVFLLHLIPADLGTIHRVLSSPGAGMHSKLRLIDLSWSGSARFTLWTALIGAASLNAAVYGCDQDLAQRVLTTRSAWRGGAALIGAQCLATVLGALFMVAGLLLYVFYCRPDVMGAAAPVETPVARDVYTHFLLHYLPTGLRGLAIAGILATAQGSLDSAINAMASSVVADLYWPLRRRLRWTVDESAGARAPWVAVLGAGAALIGVAIAAAWWFDPGGSLMAFALGIMSYAFGGMFGVFLAAIFTRRGNARSVIAALVMGAVVTGVLQKGICLWWTGKMFGRAMYLSDMWWLPISAGISFAVCVMGNARPQGGDPIGVGVFP